MWKPVEQVPGWEISEAGVIRTRRKRGRASTDVLQSIPMVKVATVNSSGYEVVSAKVKGKIQVFYVHALVAEAFIGPRPLGAIVRHLDSNPTNNHVNNLAYGTQKDNWLDRTEIGQWGPKATADEVLEIRQLRRAGWKIKRIAKYYPHLSYGNVCAIVAEKTWKQDIIERIKRSEQNRAAQYTHN